MKTFIVVALSLLVALLLEIIPVPSWAVWLRPEWVVLTLFYWALVLPDRVGVNVAFSMGILMDLLTGTLLGEHALVYVLVSYITVRFAPLIRLFPLWQQGIVIFLFIILFQTFKFWIWGLSGGVMVNWVYWLPGIISAILWPWIYMLMRGYQGRYRVY